MCLRYVEGEAVTIKDILFLMVAVPTLYAAAIACAIPLIVVMHYVGECLLDLVYGKVE